jgi:hypothetical protein
VVVAKNKSENEANHDITMIVQNTETLGNKQRVTTQVSTIDRFVRNIRTAEE